MAHQTVVGVKKIFYNLSSLASKSVRSPANVEVIICFYSFYLFYRCLSRSTCPAAGGILCLHPPGASGSLCRHWGLELPFSNSCLEISSSAGLWYAGHLKNVQVLNQLFGCILLSFQNSFICQEGYVLISFFESHQLAFRIHCIYGGSIYISRHDFI